jgi:hypothetical protein
VKRTSHYRACPDRLPRFFFSRLTAIESLQFPVVLAGVPIPDVLPIVAALTMSRKEPRSSRQKPKLRF